jgi:hypothetical protein
LEGFPWWGLCGTERAGGRLGRVGAAGWSWGFVGGVWGRVGLLGDIGTAATVCICSVRIHAK